MRRVESLAGPRRWLRLLAAVSSAALLAALPLQAAARCQLRAFNIPVQLQGKRAIATVSLNGTELRLIVDSGAHYSFLTEAAASQLKLQTHRLGSSLWGHTGRFRARYATVDTVQIGKAVVRDVQFGVGINESGLGTAGVLGRNFLGKADTEYDLAHGVVRLVTPNAECTSSNLAYWAAEAPVNVVPLVESAFGDTTIRVVAQVNGEKLNTVLDTGAPGTLLLLKAAQRAGIQAADMRPLGRSSGAGAGHAQNWSAPVALFELGGETIKNNRFEVDDADGAGGYEMLLGIDYFLSHHIYVSRLQHKLYATWNGGPVFALNKAGAGDAAAEFAAPQTVADTDADGLARRGQGFAARGDYTHALADLDRALTLAPQSAPYHAARAGVQQALLQPAKALADLDAALQLEPTLQLARIDRAALRAEQQDRSGALADLQTLDAALAPSAALRATMGEVFAKLERPGDALRQWSLWLQYHANDAARGSVFNRRCWLRTRLKLDLPAALEDCQRALDVDNGNADFHTSLGWLRLRLNEPRRAVDAFDEAIKLRVSSPEATYGRATAHRMLGQTAAAQADLLAARQLKPGIDAELRREGFDSELFAPAEAASASAPASASASASGAAPGAAAQPAARAAST